jgi:hypothetical protein
MKTQQPSSPKIDEQAAFMEGAKHGQIAYRQLHQGKALTPRGIYDLLMTMLLDTTHHSVWNAGYITGWYAAKYHTQTTLCLSEQVIDTGAVHVNGMGFHWTLTIKEPHV